MQKGHKHKKDTINKQRESALKRDNTNRIKALPRGSKHWNYLEKPSVLALHKRIHRKYGSAIVRNSKGQIVTTLVDRNLTN